MGASAVDQRWMKRVAVLSALLALGWWAVPVGAAPRRPMASRATTLSDCTFAKLKTAVVQGGTITFACSGTIDFGSAIVVGGGSVTLDASGQSVTLNGASNTRLFEVTRGKLTLVDLTLENGKVTGDAGSSGHAGTAGTNGDDGQPGTNGNNGIGTGASGTQGDNGQPGDDGDDGTAGHKGTDGSDGDGGAVKVSGGAELIVAGGTFKDDSATGGKGGGGGKGGNGGRGGQGGAGGNGGNGAAGDDNTPGGNGGPAGDSAAGGIGGKGEDGGDAGAGADGNGGAIYSEGTVPDRRHEVLRRHRHRQGPAEAGGTGGVGGLWGVGGGDGCDCASGGYG